jgi:hypothetical protein
MAGSMRSSVSALQGFCLGAAASLAAITLNPGQAEAYVVTVGGVQYDVTTFTGSYDDNASKFKQPVDGGQMPWWTSTGNATAIAFATAVGNYFGPNTYYAWNDQGAGYIQPSIRFNVILWTGSSYTGTGVAAGTSLRYAVASRFDPLPGPLPLLGAAAAFGFSRKLRTRIQTSRHPLCSQVPRT